MHHKVFDEFSRVTENIALHGRDYLPESFNLEMAQYPDWKEDIKEKWITKKGFDTHSGVTSAHALKINYSGAGKTVLHTQS